MSKKQIIVMVGVVAYLFMPLITREMVLKRGYYAIGGEWLIPIYAMVIAYLLLYKSKRMEMLLHNSKGMLMHFYINILQVIGAILITIYLCIVGIIEKHLEEK